MNDISKKIKPNRPGPVETENPFSITKKYHPEEAALKLISGNHVLIEDRYSTGMTVLSELKEFIFDNIKKESFKTYRSKRSEYHQASNNLLAPVKNNKLALGKSPDIGWLKNLYPDIEDFFLSFPQIQGLNSSWQWYINGIKYPVLKKKLHPFYGVYFPTRYDHLYLFDYWLKKYSGPKSTALDIGTGCGILSFQFLNKGFNKVYATDINPNSIISVIDDAKKLGYHDQLEAWQSNLFDNVDRKTDLIVFNPPWLPAQNDSEGLDKAIYYEPDLFDRFFDEAFKYVNKDGKIIFLYSNLAEITEVQNFHPVKNELSDHQRYKELKRINRKISKPSTKRRDHRQNEYVELWELGIT